MKIFEQMTTHGHERVAFHTDSATGLRAIIAIHSTALGNALGGTRRWAYTDEAEALRDVLRLSEGMTYKAAAADLPMGGAKSVIMIEKGKAPTEAEARAMGRFVNTFGGTYIAAEDVGVNTQYCDWMASESNHIMGGVSVSHGGDPSPYTSQGCFNGMKACLHHLGRKVDFSGLKVGIQGLGATGYKLAKLCVDHGAKVVGTDVNAGAVERAVKELGITGLRADENLFAQELDILAPCALGAVLENHTIKALKCKIVCGTANNQLHNPDVDGPSLKQRGILYGPDFVVNAGGLIRLAGLYLGMTEAALDKKVAQIEETTLAVLKEGERDSSTHAAAVAYAKRRIEAGRGKTAAGKPGSVLTGAR
jgi:leucine dehydrogenase